MAREAHIVNMVTLSTTAPQIERAGNYKKSSAKERERERVKNALQNASKPVWGATEWTTSMTGRRQGRGVVKLADGGKIIYDEDSTGKTFFVQYEDANGNRTNKGLKQTMFFSKRSAIAAQKKYYKEKTDEIKKRYNL